MNDGVHEPRPETLETERRLWEHYEAAQTLLRFENGFKWACGTLMAVIMAFNAFLVYLIWFK